MAPGHGHRQAGQQHGHAGHVAVVLAGAVGVAEVDLVDRRPGRGRGGRSTTALTAAAARSSGRTPASAPPMAADRRAHGIDDEDVLRLIADPPRSMALERGAARGTARGRSGAVSVPHTPRRGTAQPPRWRRGPGRRSTTWPYVGELLPQHVVHDGTDDRSLDGAQPTDHHDEDDRRRPRSHREGGGRLHAQLVQVVDGAGEARPQRGQQEHDELGPVHVGARGHSHRLSSSRIACSASPSRERSTPYTSTIEPDAEHRARARSDVCGGRRRRSRATCSDDAAAAADSSQRWPPGRRPPRRSPTCRRRSSRRAAGRPAARSGTATTSGHQRGRQHRQVDVLARGCWRRR